MRLTSLNWQDGMNAAALPSTLGRCAAIFRELMKFRVIHSPIVIGARGTLGWSALSVVLEQVLGLAWASRHVRAGASSRLACSASVMP